MQNQVEVDDEPMVTRPGPVQRQIRFFDARHGGHHAVRGEVGELCPQHHRWNLQQHAQIVKGINERF